MNFSSTPTKNGKWANSYLQQNNQKPLEVARSVTTNIFLQVIIVLWGIRDTFSLNTWQKRVNDQRSTQTLMNAGATSESVVGVGVSSILSRVSVHGHKKIKYK